MIQRKNHHWSLYIVAVFAVLLFVLPLYMILINSFKTQKGILIDVLAFPKGEFFTFNNYTEAFRILNFFRAFRNSLGITVATVIFSVGFFSLAAWALVRTKSKLSTVIFMMFVSSMLIPFQSVMLPLVSLMGKTHMLHPSGLVFVYLGFTSSLSIVLYHGFIKSVPVALEEAATIDGCSRFRVFWQIVFPLLKTTTVMVAILNSMWIWNDFLLPQLIINKPEWQTIPLRMFYFFGQFYKRWDLGLAGLVLSMIPIVVFYLFMQKHIVKSIAQGAIK